MAEFPRTKAINELLQSIGNNKIKIITGIRRCGKTYLLKTLLPKSLKKHKLVKDTGDVLIIELKGKDSNIRTKKQLISYLNERLNKNRRFIVIDEVQRIEGFYEILIDYHLKHLEKEIFLTGSNSKVMSVDILRQFQESGQDIHLSPLAFKEIREMISDYSFDLYLRYGGLPYIVNIEESKKEKTLNDIYKELYEADIEDRIKGKFKYISKNKVKEILKIIFNTTSEVSVNKIASRFIKGIDATSIDQLTLKKEIEDTLHILVESYLIEEFENDQFDGRDILKNIGLNKKYYCVDNGLLYINFEHEDKDIKNGILLENAVYLYLVTNGIKVRGKLLLNNKNDRTGEIDFNYAFKNKNYHVQVTYKLHDGCFEREVGNLLKFKDDSHKTMVYYADESTVNKNSLIDFVECERFLLDGIKNDDISSKNPL